MNHLLSFPVFLFLLFASTAVTGKNPHLNPADQTDKTIARYDSMATASFQKADYQKALLFYNQSLALKKDRHNLAGILWSYEKISSVLQAQKKYKKAIPYELRAVELVLKIAPSLLESYYLSVKKLLPKATDSLNITRLYYKFSLLLSHRGATKRAIGYLKKSLELAQGLKNDKAIATITNDLGGEYWDLGKRALSTQYYKLSLQAAKRLQDSNRIAGVLLNLGDNYKEQGKLKIGMEQFLKALKLKEHISDSSHLSFYYIKAGEISNESRNWKNWEKYILKAYALRNNPKTTSPMEKAIIYENMGGIAELKNQNQQALSYYDTLMQVSKKAGYENGQRNALTNKAHIYQNRGQLKTALKLIGKADKLTTENPFYQISSNNQKAELYRQLGNYSKALTMVKANISMPALANYALAKRHTLELLYRLNARLRHYQEAFRWNDSLRDFENYLRDKDVRIKITELETKYQTEKKEHQIKLLTVQNKITTQQIRIAILIIIILFIIIMLGVYAQRMNKLKAGYREAILHQQLFRVQMNPHFIFNALASIQNFMLQNETRKAAFYMGKFAAISRLVLEYSTRESIPLSKEVEILQSYIELERMRKGYMFAYDIIIDESLETDFIEIPPMALQPFVENAIKHGLKDSGKDGYLKLNIRILDDIVEVTIEDNGIGIQTTQKSKKENHKSMAMDIFEKRRRLWEKQLKKTLLLTTIDLSSEGKTGTLIIIHLPIL